MENNLLTGRIIGICLEIHKKLGPGLLESVYETVLEYELKQNNLFVERQKPITLFYNNIKMEAGFRIDLLVENSVILEIKSIENLSPVHYYQVLTYLKLSNIKIGLLINFNTFPLKNGIRRIIN